MPIDDGGLGTKWKRCSLAAAVCLGLAGCAQLSGGNGEVVGVIHRCEALVVPGPQYAAGTVSVLKGTVRWRTIGPGTSEAVFPTDRITSQTTGSDGIYQFQPDPGAYVLAARYASGNAAPWATVVVKVGVTTRVDIPNLCL